MMPNRVRFWVATFSASVLIVLLAIGGCATSGTGFDDDDDDDASGGGGPSPCGVDCSTITGPDCHVGICDADTLTCAFIPANDGAECEDGLFCTVGDACVSGTCMSGQPNTCQITPEPCQQIVCQEASQSCTTGVAPDGGSCQPTDLCQVGGVCTGGSCLGSTRNCQYAPGQTDCHVADCNPSTGECEVRIGNENGACDDENDPCQVDGSCAAGVCTSTSLKDCSNLTDPETCTLGECNSSGACVAVAGAENDPCSDLDGCTTGDHCSGGTCVVSAPISACGPADNCCPTAGSCGAGQDGDCYGNDCATPIDVSSVTFPHMVTAIITFDGDPTVAGSCDTTPTNAVWFSYQASATGNHDIDLLNATTTYAYSRVAVFQGTACGPLGTELACETKSAKDVQATVNMTSGQTYLIVFHTDGATYTMVNPRIDISPP